jgi:hypothetical protein
MRGLDPRIHDETRHPKAVLISLLRFIMDCRIEPGNDVLRGGTTNSGSSSGQARGQAPAHDAECVAEAAFNF